MDLTGVIERERVRRDYPIGDEPAMDAPPAIGAGDRRMQVRAYHHWISLLRGRACPSTGDLDPASADFGPYGAVIDMAANPCDPLIPYLGRSLWLEGGGMRAPAAVSEIAAGTMLARMAGHLPEITTADAPIGFEAEFVNRHGREVLYRGLLMPFSTRADTADIPTLDTVYGVVNWKEGPEPAIAAALEAELAVALDVTPPAAPGRPAWDIDPLPAARAAAPCATIDGDAVPGGGEFVLLVGRRMANGGVDVIGPVADTALLHAALRHLAD